MTKPDKAERNGGEMTTGLEKKEENERALEALKNLVIIASKTLFPEIIVKISYKKVHWIDYINSSRLILSQKGLYEIELNVAREGSGRVYIQGNCHEISLNIETIKHFKIKKGEIEKLIGQLKKLAS